MRARTRVGLGEIWAAHEQAHGCCHVLPGQCICLRPGAAASHRLHAAHRRLKGSVTTPTWIGVGLGVRVRVRVRG